MNKLTETEACRIALRALTDSVMEANMFKQLYIDMLKKYDDDLCEKCKNNPHVVCDETCPDYVEGRGGTLNGKYVNFSWSCLDFDHGDCPRLKDTPCHKCFDNGFDHFELEE